MALVEVAEGQLSVRELTVLEEVLTDAAAWTASGMAAGVATEEAGAGADALDCSLACCLAWSLFLFEGASFLRERPLVGISHCV